jgi:RimJ/RimL family protein N-acetyltransferase
MHYLFGVMAAVKIESGFEIGNTASRRVLEKCGFLYEKDWENTFESGLVRREKLYYLTKEIFVQNQ